MASRIKLLPDSVANQIAAGEVVNRPASVVKELMENAVDAGATSVTVNFRDGGRELIQIKDDGCGMSPTDARLAFERHATSKIGTVDDIYSLMTFGFRGEALASIAAVAQVELQTRQDGDELGTRLLIDGGSFRDQQAAATPKGTQIWIRNLFYNVPARKKFLDKGTTEAIHIMSEFQRVALCHPEIAFQLYRDDAPAYNLPASPLLQRIVGIVGKAAAPKLLEVSVQTSIARVYGFIGRPTSARQRNKDQFLFVNGRYFRNPFFHKAIVQAYEKLIPATVQPSYFIYMDIDPEQIDVNVHPQKTEVKFGNQSAIWQIINAAVRETLAKSGVVPMMDFDSEERIDIPVLGGRDYSPPLREPDVVRSRDYNPFTKYEDIGGLPDFATPPGTMGETVREEFGERFGDNTREGLGNGSQEMFGDGFRKGFGNEFHAYNGEDLARPAMNYDESEFEYISSADEPIRQTSVDFDEPKIFSTPIVTGEGYAAAMYGNVFVVVHLRRAREAVLFHRFNLMFRANHSVSQQLLFPERMALSADDYALLKDNADEFAAFGFDVRFADEHAIEIAGTPADMPSERLDEVVYDMLDALRDGVFTGQEARREKLAAVMARTGAGNSPLRLSADEATGLLAALAATDNPSYTPWGKPVMAEITTDEIRNKLK